MCKYECTRCEGRVCTIDIKGLDASPSVCPIYMHSKSSWRLHRPDDNRPLIVWEDTQDPAIRQLQEYVGRMAR